MDNKVSLYSCEDRQIARANHSLTKAYNTPRIKSEKRKSESNIIADRFLTLPNALNIYFGRSNLTSRWITELALYHPETEQGPSTASSYPKRKAQQSRWHWAGSATPNPNEPSKFSLTPYSLSTHARTSPNFQVLWSFYPLILRKQ